MGSLDLESIRKAETSVLDNWMVLILIKVDISTSLQDRVVLVPADCNQ